jgi:hypothetical protein
MQLAIPEFDGLEGRNFSVYFDVAMHFSKGGSSQAV